MHPVTWLPRCVIPCLGLHGQLVRAVALTREGPELQAVAVEVGRVASAVREPLDLSWLCQLRANRS